MSHTPGPWEIHENGRSIIAMAPDEVGGVLTDPERHSIARTYGPSRVSRPNAQLIAAAPDLLAACEAALALFQEQVRILCGAGYTASEYDDEVDALLRAAIAKARGDE